MAGRGHVNVRGLTLFGAILLEEMRARGMIIDIDHMSQKALDAAPRPDGAADYPVISSHSWFRELAFTADEEFDPDRPERYPTGDVHKVAHENAKRGDQVDASPPWGAWSRRSSARANCGALGSGHAAPQGQGAASMPRLGHRLGPGLPLCGGRRWAGAASPSAATSTAPPTCPGPALVRWPPTARATTRSAWTIGGRRSTRQANGVRYDEPIRDYRWFRFDESGAGAMTRKSATSGRHRRVQGRLQPLDPGASRRRTCRLRVSRLSSAASSSSGSRARIDNIARGLWAFDEGRESGQDAGPVDWAPEQRAAFRVRSGTPPAPDEPGQVERWRRKIQPIWDKWSEMEGDNPPLLRCKAGPRRDFDINIDGMAHYGLLPDLLQDIRNAGVSIEDFAPLFRGAEDYVRMWEKCERRAQEPASGGPGAAQAQATHRRKP